MREGKNIKIMREWIHPSTSVPINQSAVVIFCVGLVHFLHNRVPNLKDLQENQKSSETMKGPLSMALPEHFQEVVSITSKPLYIQYRYVRTSTGT